MNNPVSGESSASGQGPHIAFDRADVAIRRPGHFGFWHGHVGRGKAWRGMSKARNMGGHIRKNNKPTTQPYDQKRLATI